MRGKIQLLAGAFLVVLMAAFSASAQAVSNSPAVDEDTETRLVDAKVAEVTDGRISIFARSGVEHVIAINNKKTVVTIEGQTVSLKDLREGDVITVELDEKNPVKFAKNISLKSTQEQVARVRH
ncbi:MAG: hypothetical protein H7Y30_11560 [Pyrinomonadaceae bacterium]|nr:hypothetical protein [Pyrinomonadaceae bacterium]